MRTSFFPVSGGQPGQLVCRVQHPHVIQSANMNIRSNMGVSENGGTPESSTLIGFSTINHPFGDTPTNGISICLGLQFLLDVLLGK